MSKSISEEQKREAIRSIIDNDSIDKSERVEQIMKLRFKKDKKTDSTTTVKRLSGFQLFQFSSARTLRDNGFSKAWTECISEASKQWKVMSESEKMDWNNKANEETLKLINDEQQCGRVNEKSSDGITIKSIKKTDKQQDESIKKADTVANQTSGITEKADTVDNQSSEITERGDTTDNQQDESIKKADTIDNQSSGSTEKADTTDNQPDESIKKANNQSDGSIKKPANTTNGKLKKTTKAKTVSSVDNPNKTDSKVGIKKKNIPVTRKLPSDSSDEEIIDSEPVIA
tara:strand:+ start:699 stop:1559 length:861 start_codon:yes stop_codon:yes gene_type:complete